MKTQEQITVPLNQLVARTTSGDYVYADYAFKYGKSKGVVGTRFLPVSAKEHKANMKPLALQNYLKDSWEIYCNEVDGFDVPLSRWAKDVYASQGSECRYDLSDYETGVKIAEFVTKRRGEKYEFSECVGGGRCFGNDKYSEVYNQDLLDKILKYEDGKFRISTFDRI